MRRYLAAALVISFSLTARAAFACGAWIPDSDGYPGTAFAEGPNQVSVFTASEQGYSWDRIQGPSWTRTHVLDIAGQLQGNIETDPRVDTAIANQNGSVVVITSSGIHVLKDSKELSTSIYGAALDSKLHWQVVTYVADSKRMALFSETSPGQFTEISTIDADCGTPTMLDVVVEPDDTLVSRCADQAVIVGARGQLELSTLPAPAVGLGKSSQGTSIFFGRNVGSDDLLRMGRSASSWAVDGTIPADGISTQWIIPVSESSIVVKSSQGFIARTFQEGAWRTSSALDGSTSVSSAFGAPAQVLTGQYELTLYASQSGGWTATDLGPLGVAPQIAPKRPTGGCQHSTGATLAPLLALALVLVRRRAQRVNR